MSRRRRIRPNETARHPGPNGSESHNGNERPWGSRLREAYDELWNNWVDPAEAYFDGDAQWWQPIGADHDGRGGTGFSSEAELREIRTQCRRLAVENEFAINGHENRVSYVVGTGHTYRANVKKGSSAPDELARQVQACVEQFVRDTHWHRRQQEAVRRRDRDGEVFFRLFVSMDGSVQVRFVEPGQVATPPSEAGDPRMSLGIWTEADDVETVRAYFVDGEAVEPERLQHRKANVDGNVKRGLPMYYPVRKNLRRAEKLLRNMSVVAEIQSAIALIRKHRGGTALGVQKFVAGQAEASLSNPTTGRTSFLRRYAPGTILDASGEVDYDFPAANLNAAAFVGVLQAELRAIAARLVMPEFMLTSDASNANYASTMIAEGPAVRMFQRLQAELIEDDLELLRRVIEISIRSGKLPEEAATEVELTAAAPSLAIRDELREAQVYRIEHEHGLLSPQTWSQRRGLDYEQEQRNWEAHSRTSAETGTAGAPRT